jgi:hypothetical protein
VHLGSVAKGSLLSTEREEKVPAVWDGNERSPYPKFRGNRQNALGYWYMLMVQIEDNGAQDKRQQYHFCVCTCVVMMVLLKCQGIL